MKLYLLIFTFLLTGLISCQKNESLEDILTNAAESIKEIESLNGNLHFVFGSPSPNSNMSITEYSGNFKLKKIVSDSIIGWYLTSKMEDQLNDMSYQSFYSGDSLLYYIFKDSTVQKESGNITKSTLTYSTIHKTLIGKLTSYLDKQTLSDSIFTKKDGSWLIGEISMLRDTLIDEIECYLIKNKKHGTTPKFNAVYWNEELIAVDKKTFFPVYLRTHFKRNVDDEAQIDQICSYQIDSLAINEPIEDNVFEFSQAVESKRKVTKEMQSLKLGDCIPDIKVLKLNKDTLLLSSLKGQISILDFGYIGCGNCLLASNELKKTYEHFKNNDKVRFYYVNPVDKFERVKEYSKKENMPFETLIGNEVVESSFGLSAYPKIFIVDQNLNVARIFSGYSGTKMGQEIINEINKLKK